MIRTLLAGLTALALTAHPLTSRAQEADDIQLESIVPREYVTRDHIPVTQEFDIEEKSSGRVKTTYLRSEYDFDNDGRNEAVRLTYATSPEKNTLDLIITRPGIGSGGIGSIIKDGRITGFGMFSIPNMQNPFYYFIPPTAQHPAEERCVFILRYPNGNTDFLEYDLQRNELARLRSEPPTLLLPILYPGVHYDRTKAEFIISGILALPPFEVATDHQHHFEHLANVYTLEIQQAVEKFVTTTVEQNPTQLSTKEVRDFIQKKVSNDLTKKPLTDHPSESMLLNYLSETLVTYGILYAKNTLEQRPKTPPRFPPPQSFIVISPSTPQEPWTHIPGENNLETIARWTLPGFFNEHYLHPVAANAKTNENEPLVYALDGGAKTLAWGALISGTIALAATLAPKEQPPLPLYEERTPRDRTSYPHLFIYQGRF